MFSKTKKEAKEAITLVAQINRGMEDLIAATRGVRIDAEEHRLLEGNLEILWGVINQTRHYRRTTTCQTTSASLTHIKIKDIYQRSIPAHSLDYDRRATLQYLQMFSNSLEGVGSSIDELTLIRKLIGEIDTKLEKTIVAKQDKVKEALKSRSKEAALQKIKEALDILDNLDFKHGS